VSPRMFIGMVGLALAVVGLIALTSGVSASYDAGEFFGREEASCGTAFSPDDRYDNAPAAACEEAIDTRRMWGWPLLVLGVLAAVGAATVWPVSGRAAAKEGGPGTQP